MSDDSARVLRKTDAAPSAAVAATAIAAPPELVAVAVLAADAAGAPTLPDIENCRLGLEGGNCFEQLGHPWHQDRLAGEVGNLR